jgi:diguanylate cyclase (GGDEF)-like protein
MISVFASFMLGDDRTIKLFGLGLAIAVLFDAFIIRLILVPSLMFIFGKWSWWMPAGLARSCRSCRSKDRTPPPTPPEAQGAARFGRWPCMEQTLSWLCPTPRDRERFLDMQDRLGLARAVTMVMGAVLAATLAVSTKAGWTVLAAVVLMIGIVVVGGRRLEHRWRPELWIFVSTVVNVQLGACIRGRDDRWSAIVLGQRARRPVVIVGARFSRRGLAVGVPISVLLVVAATVGVDPGYVAAHPESLVTPLTLVFCLTVYVSPLVASDIRHRAVVGDIDHFKSVNDQHGHAVGDAVLRDVAHAMRASLRTFELLYRLGGEEFLLLLPGADADDAAEVAEKLRVAVEQLHPEGLSVACSFGVATAKDGALAFAPLLRAADAALYDAKHHGRNRVERGARAIPVPA